MAFTQTDLDAVNAAMASGELQIEVAGRMVKYRSIDELIKARDTIARNSPPQPPPAQAACAVAPTKCASPPRGEINHGQPRHHPH